MESTVLWLLAVQGTIGAFDTLYFHEWRARLPGRVPVTAPELRIHALRDFLYAILFGSLPWLTWQGLWVVPLALILAAEIVLTMTDFVVEKSVRKTIGDVFAGERITHAAMGIVYGCMIANLIPVLGDWVGEDPSLSSATADGPLGLHIALSAMALGVLLSGLRDLYAAFGLPHGNWPWPAIAAPSEVSGDGTTAQRGEVVAEV